MMTDEQIDLERLGLQGMSLEEILSTLEKIFVVSSGEM